MSWLAFCQLAQELRFLLTASRSLIAQYQRLGLLWLSQPVELVFSGDQMTDIEARAWEWYCNNMERGIACAERGECADMMARCYCKDDVVSLIAILATIAREAREAALKEAAGKAKDWLEDWGRDLAFTREQYIDAQASGTLNGRRISPESAKRFAHDFGERAQAVHECGVLVERTILALIPTKEPAND